MSRIVIDARELRTSSGRYVERLLHYLQRTQNEHYYLVLLKPEDVAGWEVINPHQFLAVACPHKEFGFGEQLGLLRQLRHLEADLVHFAFPQQPTLYKGPKITTVHDLTTLRFTNPAKNPVIFKMKQRIYAQVIKRAARQSSLVITPSEFVKADLADFAAVSLDKIQVTYEAADPFTSPTTPLPDLQNKKFIMYVGRPTPHKNLERLIEAFVLLKDQHPALQLVLAGKEDANFQRIEGMVQAERIENIIFTDFVSEGQLRWLYENCAAYAFPSLSEGFSLSGLEAMAQGAPVVSSNATCLPEIYGDAAHYFDPLDVTAMADAINEVLTDKNLRKSLVTKGKKQAAKYSWQRMAEQTLALYEKVLSG